MSSIKMAIGLGAGAGLVSGILAEEIISAKTGENHTARRTNVGIAAGIGAGVSAFIGYNLLSTGFKSMPLPHQESVAFLLAAGVAFTGAALLGAGVHELFD